MSGPNVTVMTWNLFLGAEIEPVLKVGFQDQELLSETAMRVWDEVLGNDFRDRAVAIVDGIQDTMPHLVGFQEVACFRKTTTHPITREVVATETLDYLRILRGELRSRRLPYSLVGVVENTRAEVPIEGAVDHGRFVATQQVELTLRDVVLARETVQVQAVSQGSYKAGIFLGAEPSGPETRRERGWIKVHAQVGGFPFQFVNTHLETQPYSPVQLEQTGELLAQVVSDSDVTTILAGDFNSDAAASPGAASWTPTYERIMKAGFMDAWAAAEGAHGAGGYTCSHSSDLRDLTAALDQRIDFIFVRVAGRTGRTTEGLSKVAAEVIGRGSDGPKSPDGRWPSDHAGLVARLAFNRSSEPPAGPPPLPGPPERAWRPE